MLSRSEFPVLTSTPIHCLLDGSKLTRQYYEAVGHIPRFNQAPKWSDTPDALGESAAGGQEGGGEAVQHHRQLVSRHREDVSVKAARTAEVSVPVQSRTEES